MGHGARDFAPMIESVPLEGEAPATVETVAPAPAPVAPARPEALPEDYWDGEAGAPKWDALSEKLTKVQEYEAAEAARREAVPVEASAYKLDLPENVVGIDGKPVRLIADNPATKAAQELAAKHGLTQEQFTDFVAFHAGQLLADQKAQAEAVDAAMKAEMTKLGAEAPARIRAVDAALRAQVGDKAQALLDSMATAEAVEVLEALIAKTGAPAISAPHQAAAQPLSHAEALYGKG